jgi:hypothetical protein
MKPTGIHANDATKAFSQCKSILPSRAHCLPGWLGYVLVGFCSLLYVSPFIRLPIRSLDEGTFLYNAIRVMQGQIPFRDFFEVMGPGSFYWLALFFKISAPTWQATRIFLTLEIVITTLLVYFVARHIGTRFSAFPAAFLIAVSFPSSWPAVSHHIDSNLFALLSFAAVLWWLENRRPTTLFAAGALAGLTTCFLQPKGILLLLSFVVLQLILLRKQPALLPSLTWLLAGYLTTVVIILAFFWTGGALSDLIYANITWPLTNYNGVNRVPYGFALQFYWILWRQSFGAALSPEMGACAAAILAVPFVVLIALPLLLAVFALRYRSLAFNPTTLPYWLAGCALWISEIHRKDLTHLVWGSPILVVLGFYLFSQIRYRLAFAALRLTAICVGALLLVNALIAATTRSVPVITRRGTVNTYGGDPALEFLNTHVKPGEAVFIYPYCPIYYFLSAAKNPTRFSFLIYGMNTESQFHEVVQSLEQSRVRYVLWETGFEHGRLGNILPGYRSPLREQPVVEPYLREHFNVVGHANTYQILERKPQQAARRFERIGR